MTTRALSVRLISCAIILSGVHASLARAQAQAPSQAMKEAEALFQAGKWNEAARAFDAVTKAEPSNARAWGRLGVSLHKMGHYGEAVAAYRHATELTQNPTPMYNLACSYAMMKQKDQAFEWLKKAVGAGFGPPATLRTDSDLESLRDDERFAAILDTADRAARPCMYAPEHRQFDFWIGEWDVQNNGVHAGTNSVQRILDGCVLFENWTAAGGGTGKSLNFYDASTGKWQQTWVDSRGSVLNFTGPYKDGAIHYQAESTGPGNTITLHKLTFFNLAPDQVRQLWEQSSDGGKTWTTVWDGLYTRRK